MMTIEQAIEARVDILLKPSPARDRAIALIKHRIITSVQKLADSDIFEAAMAAPSPQKQPKAKQPKAPAQSDHDHQPHIQEGQ